MAAIFSSLFSKVIPVSMLSFSTPPLQVHLTSEYGADEARRSQGNHGYQTRAAMEETSRQSAEAADDDDSTSEVNTQAHKAENSHRTMIASDRHDLKHECLL